MRDAVLNWPVVAAASTALASLVLFLAVVYSRFAGRASWPSNLAIWLSTGGCGAIAWLVLGPLVSPLATIGDLYVPLAFLAAVSAMIAASGVRASGSGSLVPLIFAGGWSILVFVPVATATFVTGLAGITPVDHGGALTFNIAAGAAVAGVLVLRTPSATDGAAPPPRALAAASVVGVLVAWLAWLVAAELALDDVSTAILVNGVLGACGGIIGWVAVQRMSHQTTTWGGVVAGMISGLVAITGGAPLLSPVAATSFGILASGVACAFTVRRVRSTGRSQWYIVGAHLVAGAIGLVLIGLLASGTGFVFTGQIRLIQDQLIATLVVAAYSGGVSLLLWLLLRRLGGRVSAAAG